MRELAPLREALRLPGAVVPVVGAGLSVPYHDVQAADRLPTWRGLLEELIRTAPTAEQAELCRLLDDGDYLLVASEIVRSIGRPRVSQFISDRFSRPKFKRPSAYDALVALPINHFLTTNYDPFLAEAWQARHNRPASVVTPRDAGVPSSVRVHSPPIVLMLHGDAARPQTCVLSSEDFDRLQFGTHGYAQVLAALAMQRRLLFLGHSLSDPDLSMILKQCRGIEGPDSVLPHWYVGVDIPLAKRRWLASHGVHAIEVATQGRFEAVEEFLRALAADTREPESAVVVAARPIAAAASAPSDGSAQSRASAAPVGSGPAATAPVIPEHGPFPGLLPFDEQHEHFFCGREGETLELLAHFRTPAANTVRWIQIEGASGAGKSSLLRAGLVPAIKRGEVDGRPGAWRVLVIRPGQRPLRALAAGLFHALRDPALTIDGIEDGLRRDPQRVVTMLEEEARLPEGQRLVLAIDQFEETFTYVEETDPKAIEDRNAFATRIAEALDAPNSRLYLVTTVRRDYLEHFRLTPTLDRMLGRARRENLLPLVGEQLEIAINDAAARAGLRWVPDGLPKTICHDAENQPGALASLGLLLSQLWRRQEERGDDELRESDYEDLHKLSGVLARSSDELLARLRTKSDGSRTWADHAMNLLVAMVRRDRGAFDRRRALERDAAVRYAGGGEVGENVLEALSGVRPRSWTGEWRPAPRLASINDHGGPKASSFVEIAHERLSREWPMLDAAVNSHAQDMLWRDRLESEAHAWKDAGGGLLSVNTGPAFSNYRRVDSEDPVAREYLSKGKSKQRLRMVGVAAAFVIALGSAWSWLTWQSEQRLRAETDARIATQLERTPTSSAVRSFADSELNWLVATSEDPMRAIDAWAQSLSRLREEAAELQERLWLEASGVSERPRLENARRVKEVLTNSKEAVDEAIDGARQRARRVEEHLRQIGAENWRAKWANDVLPSLEEEPYAGLQLTPRRDLMPLRQRASDRPAARVWQFLLLGTGEEPEWNDADARWVIKPESGVVVVLVPDGEFTMGAQNRDPAAENFDAGSMSDQTPHRVELSAFYVAAHECTQSQARRLRSPEAPEGAQPVTKVDWEHAVAMCVAAGGALPTEAQWEYACRAASTKLYSAGDTDTELEDVGWFSKNSRGTAHPVGEKSANQWGLHDMHGNVWEWCADWYGDYPRERQADPVGPAAGSGRVIRGGCFWNDADQCRSSLRVDHHPSVAGNNGLGFRVALPAAPSSR